MTRWRHGLVIGKLRPPHKGHSFLIRTALEQVEHLTVIVCAEQSDTIPADLRAAWLREIFASVDVRVYGTSGYDDDDSQLWANLTRAWLGEAPDVVFTSEGYGETYARALGCEHVCVDRERKTVPISASQILAAPLAHLEFLEPCVRAHFVLRVRLVGAESTGKTTLARQLAEHYRTVWAPEYGRFYTEVMPDPETIAWAGPDFVHIAKVQAEMEDMVARHANRVLICDTDPLTTWLWHERYVRADLPAVRTIAATRRYQLTILAADDIPWEDDGTRDRPEERSWFQGRFREGLEASGRPYLLVEGPPERRLATATAAIDRLLRAGGVAAPSPGGSRAVVSAPSPASRERGVG
jgi:NadR type nicotinamide-nucleotide adenylyltransferase